MNARLPRRGLIATAAMAACAAALLSSPAWAFRPSGRWLFDQAAARHLKRGINTLEVDQEVTLLGLPEAPKGLTVPGKTVIRAGEGYRRTEGHPSGDFLEVQGQQRRLVQAPGQKEVITRGRPGVVESFLTLGGELERKEAADRLEAAAKAMKVNVDVVSFVRFDGRVNYLIGCKPWELGQKPGILFDKDTLHLTRVVAVEKGEGGAPVVVDVQLKGWGSAEGGGWFPRVIERYRGDQLVSRAVTRSVDRNQTVDKALFDLVK